MQLNKKKIVRTVLCAVLVGGALGYSFAAKSETKLLPFQGKLTDANGQVIPDKAIVVQFKMYDAPVGGNAKWNGEVQMLTVNGGLVNTTLGTKASLKNVDFSTPTYLEITIDANGDNEIGPEDPPLLPRQSIIPAVYAVEAGNSKTMGGHDWSAVFSNGDPDTGKIDGGKLADKSVSTSQIANNAVTSTLIKAGAVTTDKIANKAIKSNQIDDGAVTTNKIANGAITTEKIAGKSITTELMANRGEMFEASETVAPIGSIAKSKGIEHNATVNGGSCYRVSGDTALNLNFSNPNPVFIPIPGMSLKLETSGRPVMIMIQRGHFDIFGYAQFNLYRDGTLINWAGRGLTDVTRGYVSVPSDSMLAYIDIPPKGVHEYSLCVGNKLKKEYEFNWWGEPYLVAFEL